MTKKYDAGEPSETPRDSLGVSPPPPLPPPPPPVNWFSSSSESERETQDANVGAHDEAVDSDLRLMAESSGKSIEEVIEQQRVADSLYDFLEANPISRNVLAEYGVGSDGLHPYVYLTGEELTPELQELAASNPHIEFRAGALFSQSIQESLLNETVEKLPNPEGPWVAAIDGDGVRIRVASDSDARRLREAQDQLLRDSPDQHRVPVKITVQPTLDYPRNPTLDYSQMFPDDSVERN